MTTQDFVKGVDFTLAGGLVGAANLNNLVDSARLADGKGMVIKTADTDDVPLVPNPNHSYDGVTPLWWKAYLWIRELTDKTLVCYIWDESVPPNTTFLQWRDLNVDVSTVGELAELANTNSLAALASAEAANSTSASALEAANLANANVTALNSQITALAAQIQLLNDQLANISFSPGDIKATLSNATYSLSVNQGWLLLNGDTVTKAIFPNLWAAIQTLVVSTETTFTLPDYRGRGLVMAGLHAPLTLRQLGTVFGEESVTLDISQVPDDHEHEIPVSDNGIAKASASRFRDVSYEATAAAYIGKTAKNVRSAVPHTNMGPSFAANLLIKT